MNENKSKKTTASQIDRVYLMSSGNKSRPVNRPKEKRPSREKLLSLYQGEEYSIRSIANQLGFSKDMVYRALKDYGIERRGQGAKRSKLRDYDLNDLKVRIKQIGLRAAAREIGISHPALRDYIKGSLDDIQNGR